MNKLEEFAGFLELHDLDAIREAFSNGTDPNATYKGSPLIDELTSEYTRGSRFRECVRAFADAGLVMDDQALLAVLLDDAVKLEQIISEDQAITKKNYTLRCAYTPLTACSLLHICAEFNHVSAAKILVKYGADVNAAAGFDEFGFGGQTPIFHTVNQNGNHSAEMLQYLLSEKADLKITVPGLIWGKGYPWETLIPAVNPVSYAMFGMLPQMHRNESVIAQTVTILLKHGWGIDYEPGNIPNAYLNS